ncbi:conserved hypothetical protein [Tenacibaculum maritimum]|uniref:DUF7935 family protein n=1 Tax=Tenacibaculum maritimum TaxID=107401 RepID=UPI0012E6A72F|nr:hypothetical protein [Tenacibaculum maritimum]CAA0185401.1 conserved hypothetical protein [Tenacibaculum maritimum]CAA0187901.1 conserved hypothetical protein [Tenacibaculum maritimum]CAA0191350.1 conserved hypothetical protein [Tenacibaculum maritimum]
MENKILEGLSYALPAIVTGLVAYYFFSSFLKHNATEKKFKALAERKRASLPIKLQAYERLLLFCERIHPLKLLVRVKPIGNNTNTYLQLLIGNMEQEFDHNLVQQIYISEDTWTAIITAKIAIINKLKELSETAKTADELRENILANYSKNISPTETAISFIKNEVRKLL